MISNFQEFEGEVIKYSDYVSDSLKPGSIYDLSLSSNTGDTYKDQPDWQPGGSQNAWTPDDSQKLSEQMYGVKHPWTRKQYEKLADPEVKRDVSYDAYLNMWDSESRRLLPQLPKKPTTFIEKSKAKLAKSKPQNIYDTAQPNTARLINKNDIKYKEPVDYARPIIINNHTHDDDKKGWSSIRIETRIMLVTMIIGVILSFMTVLILILK